MGLFSTLGTIAGGFFGPVGAKIGGALGGAVGGIVKNKQDRKNAKAGQMDLGALRADAKANGFNPSSVLRLTGGGGYTQTAAPPSFLSSALGGMEAGIETQYQKRVDAYDRGIQNELFGAQTANLNASTSAIGASVMANKSGGYSSAVRPTVGPALAVPSFDGSDPFPDAVAGEVGYDPAQNQQDWLGVPMADQPRVNVQTLAGKPTSVPASWAYAAKLRDGDTMTSEHNEAWLAEVGSNAYSVAQAADITGNTWFGGGTPMFPTAEPWGEGPQLTMPTGSAGASSSGVTTMRGPVLRAYQ